MVTGGPHLRLLTDEEVNNIYDKSVAILANKGLRISHAESLKLLARAGAQVDFDSSHVRFPKDIIETALRTVPRRFSLAGRAGRADLVLPHPKGLFYTRTGTGARNYIEPVSHRYRDVSLADVAELAQLIEVLDELDIISYPTPRDVPEQTADIHALKVLLENSSKHVMVQGYSGGSTRYLLELAAVAAGGTEELRKKAVVHTITGCITPLEISEVFAEMIVQSCNLGVPLTLGSLPSAGGTSPVTIAGTVLMATIENLAPLVMAQLIKPGIPLIGVPIIFTIDMMTGRNGQSSIESILGGAAVAQVVREALHIPTHTYGFGTDSYIPDLQAAIEGTLRGAFVSLAGCDILGGAGQLDVATAVSPVQLVIDNALTPLLRRGVGGVQVDDEALAWQEIQDTAPGSHFLERAHTRKHCREQVRSSLFVNSSREVWMAEGSKDLYARAVEEYQALKKKMRPQPLPDDVRREMARIVKHADEHMVK